jgi:hypothetical protein
MPNKPSFRESEKEVDTIKILASPIINLLFCYLASGAFGASDVADTSGVVGAAETSGFFLIVRKTMPAAAMTAPMTATAILV